MLQFYLSTIEGEGQREKFAFLYHTYRNIMLYRAKQILRDEQLAEDAVHNAFIKIANSIEKIDVSNCHRLASFMVVIVENVAKTMYGKRKRENVISFDDIEYSVQIDNDIIEEILIRNEANVIADKIALLSENDKNILVLRYLQEYSDREIAKILDLSYAATRKRLERARQKLAAMLKEGDHNEPSS